MDAMSVRPEVRALPAYAFEARPAAIKLDQNESPLDLPEGLRDRVLAKLASGAWNRYPEMHPMGLAATLGARHDWPAEGVTVAGGSNLLIQTLTIVAGLGRRVLTVAPTFSVYALQAKLLGAELTEVPLGPGFSLPVDALRAELARGEGVLFLASPMAPTGNRVPLADLRRVVEAAGPGWMVVIDEAYAEFSGDDHRSLAASSQVVRLRTMSKAYGLAGVRLGYAMAQPELSEQLRKACLPFWVSAMQVAVAEAVLEEEGLLEERIGRTLAERDALAVALASRPGVEVFPSVTNFLLLRVADAGARYRQLQQAGVLLRRQDGLPGLSGCLRVSVGTPEENVALLEAWDQAPDLGHAAEVAHG